MLFSVRRFKCKRMSKPLATCASLLTKRYVYISAKNNGVYRLCYSRIFPTPFKARYTFLESFVWSNSASFSTVPKSNPPNETTAKPAEKKGKPDAGPMVTLVGTNGNISVVSLLEAQKISTRRNLRLILVKEMDTKTQRPEYKLMTTAEYLQGGKEAHEKVKKKTSTVKGEKILNISHKITEHDLNIRIKNIFKWILKSYEVKVIINGDSENMNSAEHVYETIAKAVDKEGKIVQKRQKGIELRFQILPPKKENNGKESKRTSKEEGN